VKHISIKQPYPRFLENKTRMTIGGKRYRVGNKNHPFNSLYKKSGIYAVLASMGWIHFPRHDVSRINEKVKELFDEVEDGYVYIIKNPAWKGWVKVGMAIDAFDRTNAFQTGSPFRDYVLVDKEYFEDRRFAEKFIHHKLQPLAKERNGEWFRAGTNVAVRVLRDAAKNVHPYSDNFEVAV